MRHCREDYEAIQPWPTKRPHFAKVNGETTALGRCPAVIHGGPGSQSAHPCERIGPHEVHYNSFYDAYWETADGWANSGRNLVSAPDKIVLDPIIPEDEPVFLIRAQDVVGPAVVNEWARLAEINGADPALCERVRAFALEMKAYADEHGRKTPDTPEGMLKP